MSDMEQRVKEAIERIEAGWAKFRSKSCLQCGGKNWGPIKTVDCRGLLVLEADCYRCGFRQKDYIERPLTNIVREGGL